tara:strand:+ start:4807 stop:5823 length:1017 start_codon:yes stop_codon:yes gene_type:complete
MELSHLLIFTSVIFPLSYIFRLFLVKKKIYDKVSPKKIHEVNTPKGLGLVLTPFIIALIYLEFNSINWEYLNISRLYFLIISLIIFFIISTLDDWIDLNPYFKLVIQLSVIFFSLSTLPINLKVEFVKNYIEFDIPVRIFEVLIIYLWVFMINENNFHDGVDGNHSIKNFMIIVGYMIISMNDQILNSIYYIILIYMFCGYVFSFNKIKFFIGDSGSIPIGLIMGWLFIINIYNGNFFEALILNLPYFIDIIITHFFMIKNKQNIFERHNNFIFQKIYFLLNKNRFKHNVVYLFINTISFIFIALTNIIFDIFVITIYLILICIFYFIVKSKYEKNTV